MSQSSPS